MTEIQELQTIPQLAQYLGYDESSLLSYLYKGVDRYRVFTIPKKTGGERTIHSPCKKLKEIQRKISTLLQKIYTPKPSVHGFIPDRSIVTNAKEHSSKKVVINIDLKDFFPSITFHRIYGTLRSGAYQIPNNVSAVIAHACCRNGALPIGAPSSPIISNMVAKHLDTAMLQYCKAHSLRYTRYADDITLSTNKTKGLSALLSYSGTSLEWSGSLIDTIHSTRFEINQSKIRVQLSTERQRVTGLTVNKFPNKDRGYINKIRGALASWEHHGYKSANDHHIALHGNKSGVLSDYISGCMAHLFDVRGHDSIVLCNLMKRYSALLGKEHECHKDNISKLLDSTLIAYDEHEEEIGTAFLLYGIGIVTCKHVSECTIKIAHWKTQDKKYFADVHKAHDTLDIAILNVPGFPKNKHRNLRIASNTDRDIGSKYMFSGFPNYAGGPPSVYKGTIANKVNQCGGKQYKLDKDVYGGASGAPLVDSDLYVIGIVTQGFGSDHKRGETDAHLALNICHLLELI